MKVLLLGSDGCGAQNKNYSMMGMIGFWFLNTTADFHKIEYVFSIIGNSFLPADRVFARIENEINRNDIIIDTEEYTTFFSEFDKVILLQVSGISSLIPLKDFF
jgi:hypothetical protein